MKGSLFETKRGDRRKSGVGLLVVLVMAAVVAVAVYAELPRATLEGRRQKEQLLIERGEQYQRAIELFFRANGRYPARIEELENSGNRRFLRHRFIDPMTGRDDWRLIRIGPGGVLLDSAISGSRLAEQAQIARAARQSQTDSPAGPTGPGPDAVRATGAEGEVASASGTAVPSPSGVPGPTETVKPPESTAPAPPTVGSPAPSPALQQSVGQAVPKSVAPPGPAAIMQAIGGGIAGVASKSDQSGVMVYHGHTNYREWEFIFDFTKRKSLSDGSQGVKETRAVGVK